LKRTFPTIKRKARRVKKSKRNRSRGRKKLLNWGPLHGTAHYEKRGVANGGKVKLHEIDSREDAQRKKRLTGEKQKKKSRSPLSPPHQRKKKNGAGDGLLGPAQIAVEKENQKVRKKRYRSKTNGRRREHTIFTCY